PARPPRRGDQLRRDPARGLREPSRPAGQGHPIAHRAPRVGGGLYDRRDSLFRYAGSGRSELHKTHLDITGLVQEVIAEFASATPSFACAVKVGDLPDVVADERMMRFMFTNLIPTACKFARDGQGPSVEVGGSIAGKEATYYVRDEGVGFDMRYSEKLF